MLINRVSFSPISSNNHSNFQKISFERARGRKSTTGIESQYTNENILNDGMTYIPRNDHDKIVFRNYQADGKRIGTKYINDVLRYKEIFDHGDIEKTLYNENWVKIYESQTKGMESKSEKFYDNDGNLKLTKLSTYKNISINNPVTNNPEPYIDVNIIENFYKAGNENYRTKETNIVKRKEIDGNYLVIFKITTVKEYQPGNKDEAEISEQKEVIAKQHIRRVLKQGK